MGHLHQCPEAVGIFEGIIHNHQTLRLFGTGSDCLFDCDFILCQLLLVSHASPFSDERTWLLSGSQVHEVFSLESIAPMKSYITRVDQRTGAGVDHKGKRAWN